ncbi:MAG: phosphoribosylglycinamide formyltransferase [Candidatus Binatia bacterium]
MTSKLPVGVLASGTGTNFEAIVRAIAASRLDAEIRMLVCNRPRAEVLERARTHGIPAVVVDHEHYGSREEFDAAVASTLVNAGAELVAMAGFDRVVTSALLKRFPQRVLNIHPALLPAFRGANAQQQASAYGVTICGATVHLVDEEVDHGPIIVQAAVAIAAGEDPKTIRERVLIEEHRIYPFAIQLFAEGRVSIEGRRAVVRGATRNEGEVLTSPKLSN